MEQNFLNEDNDLLDDNFFGDDTSNLEEFDIEGLEGGAIPPKQTKDIKPATEEDKAEAAKAGKAKSDKDAEAELKEKAQKEALALLETENEDTPTEAATGNLTDAQEFAKSLFATGVLTRDEDETDDDLPTNDEELVDRLNYEKEKGARQLVSSFANRYGESARKLFDAVFVNGVSPDEYLPQFNKVEAFKGMDLTDESNQVRVVETALRNSGMEAEDIKEQIATLKTNFDLEVTATRYHKGLVKTEEANLIKMQEVSKQKLEQELAAKKQYSTNIRQIVAEKIKARDFDGIPVTEEFAKKAIDFIETPKWKLADGTLITDIDRFFMELQNPQNHAAKVQLGLLLSQGYEPGKPIKIDLSKVTKKAATTEAKALFNYKKESTKATNSTPAPKNNDLMASFLDSLK